MSTNQSCPSLVLVRECVLPFESVPVNAVPFALVVCVSITAWVVASRSSYVAPLTFVVELPASTFVSVMAALSGVFFIR